jgi:hypothetical protein
MCWENVVWGKVVWGKVVFEILGNRRLGKSRLWNRGSTNLPMYSFKLKLSCPSRNHVSNVEAEIE